MKWISVGIFLFFTNSVIFSEFCRLWEVPGTKIEILEKHDVGIGLGGMFEYNSDLDQLSIRRQGDRFIQAVTLYKTNKISKLLITGEAVYIRERGLKEARNLLDLLIKKKSVQAYPVLIEIHEQRVAQAEHTFIPTDNGVTVTTISQ